MFRSAHRFYKVFNWPNSLPDGGSVARTREQKDRNASIEHRHHFMTELKFPAYRREGPPDAYLTQVSLAIQVLDNLLPHEQSN